MQIEASNSDDYTDYGMAVIMWIFAGAVMWYTKLPIVFDPRSPDFNPVFYVPVLLTLAGVYYLFSALMSSWRDWKFGVSTLEAEPAVLGHSFAGVVRTARPFHLRSQALVRLECIETIYLPGGGSKQPHYREKYRWRGEIRAASPTAENGIPFAFDVPADCPVTTSPESGRVAAGIRWILVVRARMVVPSYYALFRINVHGAHAGRS